MRKLARWERQLENYTSSLKEFAQEARKGEGEFRFNSHLIKASDIAGQYFCEKKIEMKHLHGEIKTERKTSGTKAHEMLLEGTIRIKRKDLWKKIHGEKPVFTPEMLLLARYKGVVLVGRPDSILFMKGLPLTVFEYKFSRSQRPFRNHHVQVGTYGILLRNMGFDINHLFYAIVIADPQAKNDKKLKERVVKTVIKNGPKEAILKTENARIYYNKFNEKEAENDLDWAIEFWKINREAIPTGNPNKCRSCEYGEKCSASLSVKGQRN